MRFLYKSINYLLRCLKIDDLGFILSFCFVLSGCEKFVQVPAPTTQLVTASVFNNSATATSALTNIYQEMYTNAESYNLAQQTGFLGDELTNYFDVSPYSQYYTNSMTASITNTFGPWDDAYNYIYQANAVIAGIQNNSAISMSIQQQLVGESLFIRAFWNFYLTNCYGDIPLVTTTNYATNATLSRTSQSHVYTQIISDLLSAESLLNTNFVDATDTTITTQRVRPTKWAAMALLARAYLYENKYDSAKIAATAVINNNALFSLVQSLDSVFLANSAEAIWQLDIPLPNSQNTPDGTGFILTGIPTLNAVSPQLISAFEPGDQRKVDWIGAYITMTTPNDTFYFPYKYKVSGNSSNATVITEYNMILRLGEQYLIKAEAEVQSGDLTGAAADLNVIRNRAGLPNISDSVASTQPSLLTAILHERQVELFTEWGNRWFDLIRTGNVNTVMGSSGNICAYKHGTWNAYDTLFPIPQTDRNNDPNLSQNLGY